MTSKKVTLLKVVIASPSDVKEERETLINEVIPRVNSLIAENLGLTLRTRSWETDSYPAVHVDGPQGLIDTILDIKNCDIFICIFWKRFGTPIKQGGETGTEHEFREAFAVWEKIKKPHIMLYFKTKAYYLKTSEESEQLTAVLKFKENLPQEVYRWEYKTSNKFEVLVFEHLTRYLQDNFGVSQEKIHELDKKTINQKELYLDNHSKEIAKIIYENFGKDSGLFASCIYWNGVKYIKQPSEPKVTKSGLAIQHLESGYESLWEFYQAGRDESIEKCREIEETINKYEETIFAEIERDIETNNITGFGKKLERKTIEEVFRKGDANYRYFPETFNFKPLYIYPDILSAIFNEAYNRDNEGEEQEIWIKQNDGYEYLVIGNAELQQELGFGGNEMMGELESRVKKLVDGETIRGLVRDYYAKQSELKTNSNIMNYELERERIWISVNSDGRRISGSCVECSEEYLQSHFP
jgi:hypothetical protein